MTLFTSRRTAYYINLLPRNTPFLEGCGQEDDEIMLTGTPKKDRVVSSRTLLVALLVSVLVFPPSIFADAINWNNATEIHRMAIAATGIWASFPTTQTAV